MKKLFAWLAPIFMFGIIGFSAQAQTLEQQDGVVKFSQPIPSNTTGKIEVIEFFAFNCPHCASIEPEVEKIAQEIPANAVFVRVPVAWNASMEPMQKLYFTLKALDREDLVAKVFTAIHQDRQPLFTIEPMIKWAKEQGIDEKDFTNTFNSFGVKTKSNQARQISEAYKINGTPSFAIAGKYLVSPKNNINSFFATVRELIKQETK